MADETDDITINKLKHTLAVLSTQSLVDELLKKGAVTPQQVNDAVVARAVEMKLIHQKLANVEKAEKITNLLNTLIVGEDDEPKDPENTLLAVQVILDALTMNLVRKYALKEFKGEL